MRSDGGRESLQALKRRLEGKVDAPRPAVPAASADAADDLGAEEGCGSLDVDVLHDDETNGDNALSTCASCHSRWCNATCLQRCPGGKGI